MLWLIGMMGSGKTEVGRRIAAETDLDFIDTDLLIASITESSISDLWEEAGEEEFRRLEREMISSAATGEPVVVATGGGVVLDPGNIETMRASGLVVWLTASPATLAARLGEDSGRPLLAGASDIEAVLGRVVADRHQRYSEAAHVEVSTDHRPLDDVAREVLDLWNESR